MASDGSVTRWLGRLQAGDPENVQHLWERYFPALVRLARARLQGAPRRVADEEDVALSAFDSFCRNAEQGRFPHLLDRDGLWGLLVVITARKASHLRRDQTCLKRGGAADEDRRPAGDLEDVLSREPDPELAAAAVEEYQRLLELLGDRELASVALWRMEGYTVEEIGERLGYAPRSVKRKLQLIRTLWEQEVPP